MPRSFLIKKNNSKRPSARFSFYSDPSEKQSFGDSKDFVESDRLGPPPQYNPDVSLLPTPPSENPSLEALWPAGNDLDPKPEDLSDSSSREDELDGEEKPYRCQHCSKVFTRSWNFQRHVLIHSGQKPFKCLKCPKAFALAAHLKIHNRIHTGEKPYTCNICCRGFAQLTNLQRHILTHTGEKPHKCTYCPKAFVSSSDLRRHVRIHTGERPYKCKQCSKAFTTSGNLQSHILTHTGVKPYKCQICNWKFISSSNLRTHIRIHHAYYLQQGGEKMITEMLKAKKSVDTSKFVSKEKL